MSRRPEVKITKRQGTDKQECYIGKHVWSVARLVELSRDFEVLEIPLLHMNIYQNFGNMNLRSMLEHFKTANDADLDFPIILDEDGEIFDGRHRLMKALMEDKETIKAVRFTKNPRPCRIEKD